MRKTFLIILSLLALVVSEPIYTIVSSSKGKCDSSGTESIELTVQASEELQESKNFQISLTHENGNNQITTDCTYNVEGGRLRRLSVVTYTFTCSFDSPNEAGNYVISSNSDLVQLEGSNINVELLHCISEQQAINRNKIKISFRQVNNFEINSSNNIIFSFYGITGTNLGKNLLISFLAYLIEGETRDSEPTQFACTLQVDSVSPENSYAPAPYQCTSSEMGKNTYTSLEIVSSGSIAGIPLDNILLNPVLTAKAIEDGKLNDLSDSSAPPMIYPDYFDYSKIEDGIILFDIFSLDSLDHIEKNEFTIHLS